MADGGSRNTDLPQVLPQDVEADGCFLARESVVRHLDQEMPECTVPKVTRQISDMTIESSGDPTDQAVVGARSSTVKSDQHNHLWRLAQNATTAMTRFPHTLAIYGDPLKAIGVMFKENPSYLAVKDSDGDIPLFSAILKENWEVALLMAEVMSEKIPCAFHMKNSSGHSALYIIAGFENEPGMKILEHIIKAEVNVTICEVMKGQTVLHHCAEENYFKSLEYILTKATEKNYFNKSDSKPKSTSIFDKEGNAPLHLAIQAGHSDCVRVLIDAKVDRNQQRLSDGASPLVLAVERLVSPVGGEDDLEILERLVERKRHCPSSSTNLRRHKDRVTPLHLLLMPRDLPAKPSLVIKAARVLHDQGAHSNLVYNGMTAMGYAERWPDVKQRKDLVEIFASQPEFLRRELEQRRMYTSRFSHNAADQNSRRKEDSGLGESRTFGSVSMDHGAVKEREEDESQEQVSEQIAFENEMVDVIPESDRHLLDQQLVKTKKWKPVLKRLGLATGELDIASKVRQPIVFAFSILIHKKVTVNQLVRALVEEGCNVCAELLTEIYHDSDGSTVLDGDMEMDMEVA